jgi:uncharacterized membrane protein YsdA (DUF1294 family)
MDYPYNEKKRLWGYDMDILLISYLIINLMTLSAYGIDKYKAIHQKWRISERTLLILSGLGPFGAFLGRYFFRHKTRKWYFLMTIMIFISLHLVIAMLICSGSL